MIQNLFTPILNDGLRTVNFFNGRLLTGGDLSDEQAANRDLMKRLGQATGSGIVWGLKVEKGPKAVDTPTVIIREGLALNRRGFTLRLPAAVNVILTPPAKATPAKAAGATFADCTSSQTGVYTSGDGVYLLTMAPSSGVMGRAPVSGLGNVSAPCNTQYNVDGVQFRLLRLNVTPTELHDSSRLRNHVAYKCFGAPDMLTDPFATPPETYGALDALRPDPLTDCDVPLAVICLAQPQGIHFIDMWSARRRITPPSLADHWNLLAGSRRLSEAEAMFLQFEDQVEDIRHNETNLEAILATDRFDYLPPLGILPVGGVLLSSGFCHRHFFDGQTYREPVFIEGAQLHSLVRESFNYPPIDLHSHPLIDLKNRELIWLYLVRENRKTINENPLNPPQAYLVFANGQMPYRGDARYDVNRWDYSNFGRIG